MVGHFLIIVIQHSNAYSQGDFRSKFQRFWRILHAIYPALKLKTQQHADYDHTQWCQDNWQRHTVTEDVSFPGRVVCFYSPSYFTFLIITLCGMIIWKLLAKNVYRAISILVWLGESCDYNSRIGPDRDSASENNHAYNSEREIVLVAWRWRFLWELQLG